jgi:hypothetical protein
LARRDHFLRDEDVGEQRPMRPVLFSCTDRDDDGVMVLEELLDFERGHFAEEDSWRFHVSPSLQGRASSS